MTVTAEARGWGKGWPTDRSGDVRRVDAITGSVHKDIHELVTLLCAETQRRGYRIRRDWSWGYANRPISGTRTPSNHSWGLAVDLNAPTNPMGSTLKTDMPKWMVDLWTTYGFRWGGTFTRLKDAMHFEYMGTPADAKAHTTRARLQLQPSPSTATPRTAPPPPAPIKDDVMSPAQEAKLDKLTADVAKLSAVVGDRVVGNDLRRLRLGLRALLTHFGIKVDGGP
jgi:hypothetical protein